MNQIAYWSVIVLLLVIGLGLLMLTSGTFASP